MREKANVMKKKKVMFFIYRLSYGGAARTIMNIVNHLDREKFEPILVTLDFTFDYEQYVKDDVTFIKLDTKRLRSAIIPLAKLIREQRPEILFSTIPNYNTIAILAKTLSRTKTKVIVREAAYLGGNRKENIKLRMYGYVYKAAQQVIALSNGVKENLISRYGVRRNKIKVIYNPVDIEYIEDAMLEQLNNQHNAIYSTDRKVIVTAGRLVKEKDHVTLLKAFAKVIKEIPSDLIILGEGELEETLRDLTKQLNIEAHVHFVGFQQNPYPFFHRADVFALTSTTEGFGHVLVEAMATETPVVSTRCTPGGEEVLQNGTYGKICKVGDTQAIANAIIEVLQSDQEEYNKIITKGKQRANMFSVKQIVKQYEETFLDILKK